MVRWVEGKHNNVSELPRKPILKVTTVRMGQSQPQSPHAQLRLQVHDSNSTQNFYMKSNVQSSATLVFSVNIFR